MRDGHAAASTAGAASGSVPWGRAVTRRRLVLAFAVVLCGGCGWFGRTRPDAAPAAIDLNRASRHDIEQLPGITPSMAGRIIERRPYARLDELVERGVLTERELERIRNRVSVEH